MKTLFLTAALLIGLLVNASTQNHNFTPNRNMVAKGKTTVYFVTENPERYDWVRWDFGDGQMEFSINPAHVYDKVGIYDVKMIVSKGPKVDTICKKAFVTILPAGRTEIPGVIYENTLDVSNEQYQESVTKKANDVSIDIDNNAIRICNKTNVNSEVEIRDINGNVFTKTTIESYEDIKNIDSNNLPKGLYLVVITNNGNTEVSKVYIK